MGEGYTFYLPLHRPPYPPAYFLENNFGKNFSTERLGDFEIVEGLILQLLSTAITIFSIKKIFEFTKTLSETNSNVTINKKVLILHGILLIFLTLSVLM